MFPPFFIDTIVRAGGIQTVISSKRRESSVASSCQSQSKDYCIENSRSFQHATPVAGHRIGPGLVLHGARRRKEITGQAVGREEYVSQYLRLLSRKLRSQGRKGAAIDEHGTLR